MLSSVARRAPLGAPVFYTSARYLATRSSKGPKPEKISKLETSVVQSDAESSQAPATSSSVSSLSLDFSSDEKPIRTGAKSSKDSLSSIERQRRLIGRSVLAILGIGAITGCVYLGREWDDDELKRKRMTREIAPATRFDRTKERFMDLFDIFSKPQWNELLPPPIPNPQFQKPYTLLLSIDDLLVTSTWDRKNGWRTAKRPGVDYFLAYLSQFYEIVIFTTQNAYTAVPILEKLDPYQFFISYKLFREATRAVNGYIVKDLTYLNRDLSKVIIMDTIPEHVTLQKENSIIMEKWKGDTGDKELVAMIPFLESIAIYQPQDVRPILEAYQGKNIPLEYAKKEAEGKRQFLEEWRKTNKKSAPATFTISGLFGGSDPDSRSPVPLTYLEQKRKLAQRAYLEEQKHLRDNKETFDKLIEEDRRKAMESMSGSLLGVIGGLTGVQPREKEGENKESISSNLPEISGNAVAPS